LAYDGRIDPETIPWQRMGFVVRQSLSYARTYVPLINDPAEVELGVLI